MKEADFVRKTIRRLNKFSGAMFYRNHGGMYSYNGLSDITGCLNGKFVAIECKVINLPKRGNTLINMVSGVTWKQKQFLQDVDGAGGVGYFGIRFEPVKIELFIPENYIYKLTEGLTLDKFNAMSKIPFFLENIENK